MMRNLDADPISDLTTNAVDKFPEPREFTTGKAPRRYRDPHPNKTCNMQEALLTVEGFLSHSFSL